MNRSLEQAWREISTELDEVLDLEPAARRAWLAALELSDPGRAERVRTYMADLDELDSKGFLGRALPLVLAVMPTLLPAGRRPSYSRKRRGRCRCARRNECVHSRC